MNCLEISSSPPPVPVELTMLFQDELNFSDDEICIPDVHLLSDFRQPPPPPHIPTPSTSGLSHLRTTLTERKFVPIDENSVDDFINQQTNQATARKTISDIRTLTQFLHVKNETREIHTIPPKELNVLLSQFFISARKSDGENYEPTSLKGMFCSFNRALKKYDYGHDLNKSIYFAKTRDALTAKQVELKKLGKGNATKKAESLTDDDINAMFSSGKLGMTNPTALLHTLWFFNTVYFGLRGVTEHYQMRWGDVRLCKDGNGTEYLLMNERNTKTRTGVNTKNNREIPQRAWSNPKTLQDVLLKLISYISLSDHLNSMTQMTLSIFRRIQILTNRYCGTRHKELESINLENL